MSVLLMCKALMSVYKFEMHIIVRFFKRLCGLVDPYGCYGGHSRANCEIQQPVLIVKYILNQVFALLEVEFLE